MNLLKPRPGRPQQPTPINWAHPRASGLAFFAPLGPYDRRDLVFQRAYTATGNEVFESNSAGTFHKFGTGQYVDFPVVPPSIGASTPFTAAWTQEPRATTGYSTVLHINFGTAGVHNTFAVYLSSSDSGYYFTAGPRTPSGAISWAAAIGAATNGALDRYVLRGAGGSQSTTPGDWTLYRNGQIVARGTSNTFSAFTSAAFRVGARDTGSDPFEGLIGDVRLWSRALSDQEMAAESTLRGALELYAPERIWLPVPVGASTTHTTTGALAADAATVSGAALHPHTTTGALVADAATVSGAALHPHTTTGALAAQAATVAGSSAHITIHATTGALVADAATVSGEARDESTATAGGYGDDKPRRRRYVVKVGSRIVTTTSATKAMEMADKVGGKPAIDEDDAPADQAVNSGSEEPQAVAEEVRIPEVKALARQFDQTDFLQQLFREQAYAEMLRLFARLKAQQDEEDIELLLLMNA